MKKALVFLLGSFLALGLLLGVAYLYVPNAIRPRALLHLQGVTFTLPVPRLHFVPTPNGFHYQTVLWSLEVKDRKMFLDGFNYGLLAPGDEVDISPGGTIVVNGQPRPKEQ
jgi:hypothetical protein